MTSPPPTAAYDVLQSVADAAGVDYDSRDLHLALDRASLEHPGDWQSTWADRLSAVATTIRLNCSRNSAALPDVLQLARRGAPVVIFLASGAAHEVFLTAYDRRARKLLVGRNGQPASWISRRKLLRELIWPLSLLHLLLPQRSLIRTTTRIMKTVPIRMDITRCRRYAD